MASPGASYAMPEPPKRYGTMISPPETWGPVLTIKQGLIKWFIKDGARIVVTGLYHPDEAIAVLTSNGYAWSDQVWTRGGPQRSRELF